MAKHSELLKAFKLGQSFQFLFTDIIGPSSSQQMAVFLKTPGFSEKQTQFWQFSDGGTEAVTMLWCCAGVNDISRQISQFFAEGHCALQGPCLLKAATDAFTIY